LNQSHQLRHKLRIEGDDNNDDGELTQTNSDNTEITEEAKAKKEKAKEEK